MRNFDNRQSNNNDYYRIKAIEYSNLNFNNVSYKIRIDYLRYNEKQIIFLEHVINRIEKKATTFCIGYIKPSLLLISYDMGNNWSEIPLDLFINESEYIRQSFTTIHGFHLFPICIKNNEKEDMIVRFLRLNPDFSICQIIELPEKIKHWRGSWSIDQSPNGTIVFAESQKYDNLPIAIYRSIDDGSTWEKTHEIEVIPDGAHTFLTCQADPFENGTWFVTTDSDQILKSIDDGFNWILYKYKYHINTRIKGLYPFRSNATIITEKYHYFISNIGSTPYFGDIGCCPLFYKVSKEDNSTLTVIGKIGNSAISNIVLMDDGNFITISDDKIGEGVISLWGGSISEEDVIYLGGIPVAHSYPSQGTDSISSIRAYNKVILSNISLGSEVPFEMIKINLTHKTVELETDEITEDYSKYCNVCYTPAEKFLEYNISGIKRRCPNCNSLERNRVFLSIYRSHFEKKHTIREKSILHISPGGAESKILRMLGGDNITTMDINPAYHADVTCDLMDMKNHISDNSYDCVYESYTLCFVHDDNKALQEIHRVLKPDGRLFLFGNVFEREIITNNCRIYKRNGLHQLLANYFNVEEYEEIDPISGMNVLWFVGIKK